MFSHHTANLTPGCSSLHKGALTGPPPPPSPKFLLFHVFVGSHCLWLLNSKSRTRAIPALFDQTTCFYHLCMALFERSQTLSGTWCRPFSERGRRLALMSSVHSRRWLNFRRPCSAVTQPRRPLEAYMVMASVYLWTFGMHVVNHLQVGWRRRDQ